MYSKSWFIIRDDSKRTFEVVTQPISENAFTNKTHAMQKEGMNVSCVLQPVTNKFPSKETVKQTGYTIEPGLYNRLLKQYQDIILSHPDFWE